MRENVISALWAVRPVSVQTEVSKADPLLCAYGSLNRCNSVTMEVTLEALHGKLAGQGQVMNVMIVCTCQAWLSMCINSDVVSNFHSQQMPQLPCAQKVGAKQSLQDTSSRRSVQAMQKDCDT